MPYHQTAAVSGFSSYTYCAKLPLNLEPFSQGLLRLIAAKSTNLT